MKWAIELCEFDITYQNWTALKSQVLANFEAKMTAETIATLDNEISSSKCILQVDSSSNVKGSGVGIYLKSPTGEVIEQPFH